MPILYLQKIGQNRIARQTAHKIPPGLDRVRKDLIKELSQVHPPGMQFLKQAIKSGHVVEHLNQATVGAQRDDFVRENHTV
jgi:hypothetical protein